MSKRGMLHAVGLSGLLSVAACGGSPPGIDPSIAGEFTATVTTSSPVEFSGTASSSGQAGVGWTAFFIGEDLDSGLTIIMEGIGRPERGSYQIADFVANDGSAPGQAVFMVNAPGTGHDLQSVRGTLTITSSSGSEVSGQFDFEGRQGTTDITGTVQGTFTSVHKDG